MADPFWVVWKEGGGAPTFKHASVTDAEAEAERLARTVGGTFHVLQLVATCRKNDVQWDRVADEMPF
jgi:hypothetical protein